MKCRECNSEITVYELYPRSYRLYIYLCKHCRHGFLAHHFDLNLEGYQMEEVSMKKCDNLIFLSGLKVEPRVFDFKLNRELEAIIVVDDDIALGELARGERYIYASYSPKAMKRLCRYLGYNSECGEWDEKALAEKIGKMWEAAESTTPP
jgi:hypothetical protein